MRLSSWLLLILVAIFDGGLLLSPLYGRYVLGMTWPGIWQTIAETDKFWLAVAFFAWNGIIVYAWRALRAIEDGRV